MPDLEKLQAAFKEVDEDVRAGIGKVGFTADETDGPALDWGTPYEDEEARRSDDFVAIPWRFTCSHDGDRGQPAFVRDEDPGIFGGLFPTGRKVTFRGVTIVDMGSGELYRYVDWGDVLTQLGCTVSQRVVLEEGAYVTGLENINNPPAES